ncbi:hypothetical protein HBE96_20750 [Clostridium sp. P21]|uniref:Uncharacterized protein n=1 Tax=Clostridium muellerianum TaxID=2716538 RepID=A0A7Y0HPG8_9CLOT|nr:hypothetical protein [Clostridium muellerianum]NMM65024.1 hypothetical protein [Clostridium muellerianum]
MKKFTKRTYESEKKFKKALKKLAKKGFKVLNTIVDNGKYVVDYQTRT